MADLAATDLVARNARQEPVAGSCRCHAHRETASRAKQPSAVKRPVRHCAMTVSPSRKRIWSKPSGNRLGMLASYRSAAEARTHACRARFRWDQLNER